MDYEHRGEDVYKYLSWDHYKRRRKAQLRRHTRQSLIALAIVTLLYAAVVIWMH